MGLAIEVLRSAGIYGGDEEPSPKSDPGLVALREAILRTEDDNELINVLKNCIEEPSEGEEE